MTDYLPDTPYGQAKTLENILVAACEGNRGGSYYYAVLRRLFMDNPALRSSIPEFVRTSTDLDSFWSYIKGVSGQLEPRRQHVRDAFAPLFDHLEGADRTPVDTLVGDVLTAFDVDGVHSVWEKALARRHTDPEGAITSARTLLETVCKRVLDECNVTYDDKDDLPTLYRNVSLQLQIAPSQHTEEIFRRMLGGATSVVENLGALRNKIGDAHGKGGKPVRASARHAQLAVNMAGTMATFIVETWIARSSPPP